MAKRILYGVTGEGLGHAFRSKVVLDELVRNGHRVKIVSWNRSYKLLSTLFEDVEEIVGLEISYNGNQINRYETVRRNLHALAEHTRRNWQVLSRIRSEFKPEVVVSDFDPFSNLVGQLSRVPVVCIDNLHVISRCALELPMGYERDFNIAKLVIAAMTPLANRYFITSFFNARPVRSRTTIIPPILRQQVLSAKPTSGKHILVYHTVPNFRRLLRMLKQTGGRYVVYGFDRRQQVGSVVLKPFSEDGFLRDLASARAVVTGGGFTLITEALHLGKPVYSIPVLGQFEQVLNSYYVERMGVGEFHRELDPESLLAFERRIPEYVENLRRYPRRDNSQMLAALQEFLESVT